MNREKLNDLVYEALETEKGGIEIYEAAVRCATEEDLKDEWEEYLEQTRQHEQILLTVCEKLGLDPDSETPGRQVVRHIGHSLLHAIEMAEKAGDAAAAQQVAAECITLAETKDHLNWELIGQAAKELKNGKEGAALRAAYDQVEDEEDEHLYHTQGWTRELWIQALGLPAVLPPPEEEKNVKSAIGAAQAKQSRRDML